MSRNLDKTLLYESVKTLVETDDNHIHLNQHKLFTLFSIAFQYLMYKSTKDPGVYLIRVEDRSLADKLSRKAKDQTTRRFFEKLVLPRKLNYGKSQFILDYFPMTSWHPLLKSQGTRPVKMALVVKNTSSYGQDPFQNGDEEMEEEFQLEQKNLQEMLYYRTLQESLDHTLVIGHEEIFPQTTTVDFPFIKREAPRALSGVKLASNLQFEEEE